MNTPTVPRHRLIVFLLLAGGGLWWDLFSKSAVFHQLGLDGVSDWQYAWLDGWLTFRLRTVFNHGALWGIGQGMSWLFALLSLAAVAGIIYWLFVRNGAASLWLTIALGVIMAGTLGNLYDRLGYHQHRNPIDGRPILAVRDFLLFTFGEFHWPVFNFADVFLVTGAVMLVLQSMKAELAPAAEGSATDQRSESKSASALTTTAG